MNVEDPADPLLPPQKGHHRSARERQRRGPMWGCLKTIFFLFGGIFLLLLIVIGGGWIYLGTASFADLVRLRIEKTLEERLGREVTIGKVTIIRSRPMRVFATDIRISNAPGGISKDFATVKQIEIVGGVESFWGRRIKVGRIDIIRPKLWFEIFPDGTNNFPKWKTGPKSSAEIVHLEVGNVFVHDGAFSFYDRKNDIAMFAQKLESKLTITRAQDLYAGILNSPKVTLRIQDNMPFDVDMRGGFRFTPGILALQTIALRGRGVEAFVSGEVNPLSEGAYDLHIGAHLALEKLGEPYPMKADLRYYGISLEKLFGDWTIKDTGLRTAATGNLSYRWNKDKILEGSGEGTARLAKTAMSFSNAKYAIPISGSLDYALDRGSVIFRKMDLDTDRSNISLTGAMKIEGAVLDWKAAIRSNDFSELDRLAYNFAHSAGKSDFKLLGLGGSGTINGEIKGPIDKPQLVAHVSGSGVKYNNVLLGEANLDLRYDGRRSMLTFDRAVFSDAGGTLALNGTLAFPESGPSPVFDIAVDANGYPAQRTIDAMGIDMKIGAGYATGKLIIAGSPDDGRATFVGLTIKRADATLKLDGTVHWAPGEGNVTFDLGIAANNFPLADIASFLDFANIPVTGELTGTLKIAGRKESLEGSGSVTIRKGVVMGEAVDLAQADITFTKGRMRATNLIVRAPAGEIRGEAELDLGKQQFSYTISSSSIDLSKIKLLESLQNVLGGRLVLKSTGAGTFDKPELVVEATLEGATLKGLALPPGSAPPSLYIAIRGGRLIVKGSIADIVTIDGEGSVGQDMAIDGNVRVVITDLARAVALSPATASLPALGNITLDLKLGGKLTPIEALVVEATAPEFNLKLGDHQFKTPQPLRITLRNGRISFDEFALASEDASFAVTGYADLVGDKRMNVDVKGRIEAALLQLFAKDMRADGHADVALSIAGAITSPQLTGTIDLADAQIKFAGFPQLIDEINGRLRFRGDRIEIESIRATVGGGSVILGGSITLAGMKPQRARITLQGTNVALRYYEGITIEGNFNLLFSGDLERAEITGDVDVTRALYYRDFDIQQTLLNVILSRSRVVPVASASWQDRIQLNIRLTAPGTLAVNNNIATVTGSATLDVTGTRAAPVLLGEVTP